MNSFPSPHPSLVRWLPIVLPQLIYTQLVSPKLATPPERSGVCGTQGEAIFRLILIGESSAMGVGVSSNTQSLGSVIASIFSRELNRPVSWQLSGKSGATARRLLQFHLDPLSSHHDAVFLILGVNDVLQMKTARQWRHDLKALVTEIHHRVSPQTRIFIAAIPALETFPGIPKPTRTIMGKRAVLFNALAADITAAFPQAHFLQRSPEATPSGFFLPGWDSPLVRRL